MGHSSAADVWTGTCRVVRGPKENADRGRGTQARVPECVYRGGPDREPRPLLQDRVPLLTWQATSTSLRDDGCRAHLANLAIVEMMQNILAKEVALIWFTNRTRNPACAKAALELYGNFYGPRMELLSPAPRHCIAPLSISAVTKNYSYFVPWY